MRAATPADVEAVLQLWRASGTHRTVTDDIAGVAHLIADAPGALIVAVDADVLVGSVIAGWNGWRGSIYRIAVAPSHRRRGVGTALLSAAVARLTALGARRMDAIVIKADRHARSFWDSLSPEWTLDPLGKTRYVRTG
jgi:ribosomal protein S18 acetylase RimI-like enzyme